VHVVQAPHACEAITANTKSGSKIFFILSPVYERLLYAVFSGPAVQKKDPLNELFLKYIIFSI
jgi:hypothetical protein